ncbi:4697_t:CDS:2 [Acaulospora colombiana]|uniref:4697_t:CDS:1 n=1 Tax=Acaulospora colombiana TaxID=27376 RepID=A0ACA9M626_9GLOM|nr:4697_t:CDS:2 [Acaulospora colombiana]
MLACLSLPAEGRGIAIDSEFVRRPIPVNKSKQAPSGDSRSVHRNGGIGPLDASYGICDSPCASPPVSLDLGRCNPGDRLNSLDSIQGIPGVIQELTIEEGGCR